MDCLVIPLPGFEVSPCNRTGYVTGETEFLSVDIDIQCFISGSGAISSIGLFNAQSRIKDACNVCPFLGILTNTDKLLYLLLSKHIIRGFGHHQGLGDFDLLDHLNGNQDDLLLDKLFKEDIERGYSCECNFF